ncbi:S-layer homology domain-containing protein [Cohnella sp. GCM10020058]|uniref:S-layer homology domain-containing protein n=1 Tax=Cohnella sp. GCM10020058 TaxID=3317330 RepID=UPI003638BD89
MRAFLDRGETDSAKGEPGARESRLSHRRKRGWKRGWKRGLTGMLAAVMLTGGLAQLAYAEPGQEDGRILSLSELLEQFSGESGSVNGPSVQDGVYGDEQGLLSIAGAVYGLPIKISGTPSSAGTGDSKSASVSGDGRFVAFASAATNLTEGDTNGKQDIFLSDRATGATKRISLGSGGVQANNDSYAPFVSLDGNYVLFTSKATNLTASSDTNGSEDLFLYDAASGAVERAAEFVPGSEFAGNGSSYQISANGRYVAYAGKTNSAGTCDIWLLDRRTKSVTLITRQSYIYETTRSRLSISADGRYVAFDSYSRDIVPDDTGSVFSGVKYRDVYLYDTALGEMKKISRAPDGKTGNASSQYPVVSADGRYVAYESNASNLVPGVTANAANIYVYDRLAGTNELASVGPDGKPGASGAELASLSADGRYVSFQTSDSYDPADVGQKDIYIRDRSKGETRWASRTASGGSADAAVVKATLSADGGTLVFESAAKNLAQTVESDALSDVYTVALEGDGTAEPPAWPDGAAVTAQPGAAYVALSWPAVPGAAYYKVLQDDRTAAIVTGTSYAADGLTAGTAHRYRVAAGSAGYRWSAWSAEAAVTTLGTPETVPPQAAPIMASALSGGAFVTWPKPIDPDVVGTRLLWRKPDGRIHESALYPPSVTSAVVPNLENGQFYELAAAYADGDGNRAASEWVRVKLPEGSSLVRMDVRTSDGRPSGSDTAGVADISGDGRYTLFLSDAADLVAGDGNGKPDLFVYDAALGSLALVSRTPSGQAGNGETSGGEISDDGSLIVFTSYASDLTGGADTNGKPDVFLYDRDTDRNGIFDEPGATSMTKLSTPWNGGQSNDFSGAAQISGDGRTIFFYTYAKNMVEHPPAGYSGYTVMYDPETRELAPVPLPDGTFLAENGMAMNRSASVLAINTYTSHTGEDSGSDSDIYLFDRDADELVWVTGDVESKWSVSGSMALDGDGRLLVFSTAARNGSYYSYIYDREAPAGTALEPVGIPGGSGDKYPRAATGLDISEDGRYVLFSSAEKGIVPGDNDTLTNLFVRDREGQTTSMVSTPYDASLPITEASYSGFLSADGSRFAYQSSMMNMVRGSERTKKGVYLQRIAQTAQAASWPQASALTASDVGQSSVKLTWTAAEHAEGGYRITGGPAAIDVPAGLQQAAVTGLTPDTSYTFAVQAASAGGVWTTNGPTAEVRTKAGQGLADLTLTSAGAKVTLVWGDPAPGTGTIAAFRVMRKTGGEDWTLLTTISDATARSYTDETALAAKTYTYVVRSVDGSQKEAAYSVEKSIAAGGFSISSFSYGLPLYLRQNAGHGDTAQLTLRGPAGASAKAVLTYDNVDGLSKTLETALTETGEAGVYKGEYVVPEDAKKLVSIKGTVTRDGSSAEAEALRAPVAVGGTISVLLSGTVPVPEDALLSIYSQKARAYQSVTLGSRKTVELKGLPEADDYKLSLLGAGGHDLFEESGLPDVDVDAGGRQTVSVEPLLPAALSITIANPNWRGKGNGVIVTDDAGNLLGAGNATSNGRFNLPAFKKRIGQRVHIRIEPEDSSYEPIEQIVTLVSGINQAEITLVRRTDAKIEGTVKDAEGRPVAGATVKAIFDRTYTAVTDGDGKYTLGVPTGYMYIQAFAGGSFGSDVKYITTVQGTQTVDIVYKQRIPAQVDIKLYTKSGDGEWVGPYDLDSREMVHYHISSSVRSYGGGNPLSVEAEAGQTVKICADGAEAGYKSVCATTVIGADRKAEVELRMIDKGTQIVGSLDGIQGNAVLYALENGTARKYIRGLFLGKGDFKIKVPDAGAYELVLMSNLDKNVLIRAFRLAEGEVLNLGKLTFGEQGRFAGRTGNQVLLGTSRPAPGAALQVRVQYANASFDALTNGAIVLDAPAGTALVAGSVVWKGQTVTPERRDGRYVVPIGAIGADSSGTLQYQLRMSDSPDGERLAVAPHIVYEAQGQSKEEEIGVAFADVAAVTLIAPDRTGYRKFALTGTAPAGSTVSVFAGDRIVGTAMTSPAGRWSTTVEMEGEGKTAVWQMYASAKTESTSWSSSQTTVRYDVNVAEPIEFTMRQPDGRTMVLDPREGEARFPYVLVPGWPIYLTVKFNHPELVSGVSFTIGETRLQASLKDGVYQAITDGGAVGPIGIDYTTREPADSLKGGPTPTEELKSQLSPAFRDARQENLYVSPREGGDSKQSMTYKGTLPSAGGDATMTLSATLERTSYTPSSSDQTLVNETNIPLYGLQVAESFDRGTLKYELKGYLPADEFASGLDVGKALAYMSAGADLDVYKDMVPSVKAKSAPVKTLNSALAAVAVRVEMAFASKAGQNTWKVADAAYSLYDGRGTGDSLDDLAFIMDKIARYCPPNLIPVEMEYVELLRKKVIRNELIKQGIAVASMVAGPTTLGIGTVALFIATNAIGKVLDASLAAQMKRFNDDINDLCKVPKKPKKPLADPEWIYDPSGYVYEVTEDNRIEGVKATALRWNEESKRWDIWDADWYGQENPLYTDADGRYAWDVPEGKWKVLYEKEGYRPAESEELTVLPPHFDVNIPMISTLPAKPVKFEAAPGGEAVDILFDRHVNGSTVSGSLFAVVDPATDADVPGAWTLVEPLTEGNSMHVRFTPDAPLEIGNTYKVYVNGAVQSYAGIPLGEDYEAEVLVTEHDVTPPAAVTELTAEGDDSQALVTWKSGRDEETVKVAVVYKSQGSAGEGTSVVIPGRQKYALLQGLRADTEYVVEVRSYDAAGNYSVARTSVITAGLQQASADIVPPGPAIVGSVTTNATQATIEWTDPSDADLFAVKLQWAKNGEAFALDPVTVLKGVGKYTITGLSPSTAYEVRIWTVDIAGNASSEPSLFVTTKAAGEGTGNPGNPGGNPQDPSQQPGGESGEVGAEGGTVSFFGGKLKLWLPGSGGAAGAAKKVTAAKVEGSPAPSDKHLKPMSDVYEWKLEAGAKLAASGKLTIAYDAGKLTGADIRKLGVYRQVAGDKSKWAYVGGIVDGATGNVEAPVTEPGTYTVLIAEYAFTDLGNHWSRADVEALAARGIVSGDPAGTFRPNGSVTRAEFVKLVLPLLAGGSGAGIAAERFADVPTDAWYSEAVATATAAGIVKGAEGKFRPNDPITREEMAVMLFRAQGVAPDIKLNADAFLSAYGDGAKVSGWARLAVAYGVQSGLLKGSGGKLNPGATATRAESATVVLRALDALGRITKKS